MPTRWQPCGTPLAIDSGRDAPPGPETPALLSTPAFCPCILWTLARTLSLAQASGSHPPAGCGVFPGAGQALQPLFFPLPSREVMLEHQACGGHWGPGRPLPQSGSVAGAQGVRSPHCGPCSAVAGLPRLSARQPSARHGSSLSRRPQDPAPPVCWESWPPTSACTLRVGA